MKVIDGQSDAMAVSLSQLQAGIELCSSVLSKSVSSVSVCALTAASSTIKKLTQLINAYRGPCVSTVCEVQSDVDAMLEAIRVKFTQLRLLLAGDDVVVTQSSRKLVYSGENVVDVRVPDWVSSDDVTVWVTEVKPVSAPVPVFSVVGRCDSLEIGLHCDEAVEELAIGCSVAGCPISGVLFSKV